jgi:hypothetical protein
LPITLSSIPKLSMHLTLLHYPPFFLLRWHNPPSAVRMHFYLWQTGSRSPLVSAERAPAKTPRVNSPISLRKRATLWLPSNWLAISNPSEIPPMPADGTSPPLKDFAAPIGRPRLKRAPLVWAPLPLPRFLLNSHLQHHHPWNPTRLPSKLLRLRSLRPKKTFRHSNLRQNQKLFQLLLQPLPLQPLPWDADGAVVAAVAAIISAPRDLPTVLLPPRSRAPSRLPLPARSPKILLPTPRFLRVLSIAWPKLPPLPLLCVDDPAIPVSPLVSRNWK